MKISNPPFSLRIFVADGDPDGLRVIERSNWNGKAVVFPRSALQRVRERSEFDQAGVYLLIGPREDGDGNLLYIGEADPIKARLANHAANKDFWTWAVFFVAGPGQLNKAHVQYLEARLVKLARDAKRMPLDNINAPSISTLHEADAADMEVFLQHLLGIFSPFSGSTPLNLLRAPRPLRRTPSCIAKEKVCGQPELNQTKAL